MKLISQTAGFFIIITVCNLNVIFGNEVKNHTTPLNPVKNHTTPLNPLKNHTTPLNPVKNHTTPLNPVKNQTTKQLKKDVTTPNPLKKTYLTTVDIIKKNGYPAETHTTTSKDNYVLTLHRIPHGKKSKKPGFPILIAHGMLHDSSEFVFQGNQSLVFSLAEEGYDVWLLNFRGSNYARTHTYLSPTDSKFWDFSLHELGVYDLPAHVDYVCNYTKNQNILFLGYSMGTTAFFIMGSEVPEYQKKIRGAVLLAPLATLKYSKSPLRHFATAGNLIQVLSDLYSHGEFHKDSRTYQKFTEKICYSAVNSKNCQNPLSAFSSNTVSIYKGAQPSNQINSSSSTSVKLIIHYAQIIKSGIFRQYSYDLIRNLIVYKARSPPEYHLEYVTAPLSLFIAVNDIFATPKDIIDVIDRLHSVKSIYVIPDKHFGHNDFLRGPQNQEILYPEIVKQLKSLLLNNKKVLQNTTLNNTLKVTA